MEFPCNVTVSNPCVESTTYANTFYNLGSTDLQKYCDSSSACKVALIMISFRSGLQEKGQGYLLALHHRDDVITSWGVHHEG